MNLLRDISFPPNTPSKMNQPPPPPPPMNILEHYQQLQQQHAALLKKMEEEEKKQQEKRKTMEEKEAQSVRFAELSDEEVRVMTGFSIEEFLRLEDILHLDLLPRSSGKKGAPAIRIPSLHDRLLLLLTWLRYGEPYRRLAATFDLARSTVFNTITSLLPNVSATIAAHFIVPRSHSEQMANGSLLASFPHVAAVADCTVQSICKPVGSFREVKKYYSVKHGCYGIKSFTVHSLDGQVMHIDSGEPAATSDVTMAKRDNTVSKVWQFGYMAFPLHTPNTPKQLLINKSNQMSIFR